MSATTNADLATMSAAQLAASVRARDISSRELLDLFLARIDAINPAVNAVVTFDTDRARAAAAAADDALARGAAVGPLHGLPVTVKDALETSGVRSTGGATELSAHVPDADAAVVARIKDAGAIVFAKTNVPPWSGDNQTFNELFGVTRNPWDVNRSPGGSSGGPAVSVACGFTAFELGTDIGGSIRQPSHHTGVVGHKPSMGIVPSRGYLDHVGGGTTEADINVVGPIARSVEDLSLVLDVIAGPSAHDAPGWRLDLPATSVKGLKGLRVGVWLDEASCPLDASARSVLDSFVGQVGGAGAVIDASTRPVDFAHGVDVFFSLVAAAISPSIGADLWDGARAVEGLPSEAVEDPMLRLARSIVMRHRDWIGLDEQREVLRHQWARWFEEHDVLLCPVTPTAALPVSDVDMMSRTYEVNGETRPNAENIMWAGLIGVAYLPSTVVPVGWTAEGLPVGIQIVGRYLGDRTTLAVAGLVEELTGGYRVPPLAAGG